MTLVVFTTFLPPGCLQLPDAETHMFRSAHGNASASDTRQQGGRFE
jgi:hypothetical protein